MKIMRFIVLVMGGINALFASYVMYSTLIGNLDVGFGVFVTVLHSFLGAYCFWLVFK